MISDRLWKFIEFVVCCVGTCLFPIVFSLVFIFVAGLMWTGLIEEPLLTLLIAGGAAAAAAVFYVFRSLVVTVPVSLAVKAVGAVGRGIRNRVSRKEASPTLGDGALSIAENNLEGGEVSIVASSSRPSGDVKVRTR